MVYNVQYKSFLPTWTWATSILSVDGRAWAPSGLVPCKSVLFQWYKITWFCLQAYLHLGNSQIPALVCHQLVHRLKHHSIPSHHVQPTMFQIFKNFLKLFCCNRICLCLFFLLPWQRWCSECCWSFADDQAFLLLDTFV